MHFLSDTLEQYIEQHSDAEPTLLQALSRETHLKIIQPRMITGHFQGRFLSLLSKILAPKKILEIGTYTGYSALCLAEGMVEDGKLITLDVNEELEHRVRGYFEASPWRDRIDYRIADASNEIPKLDETWDLVFIDADKTGYVDYYTLLKPKMSPNGIIIADNTLFHGEVLEEQISGKSAKAIQAFNEMVVKDEETEKIILTIRDGLTLIRKK